MRPFLLLATALGIAAAVPPPAQAQTGFTPCGARVVASNWGRHPYQGGTFRYRVTLLAPAAVRVRMELSIRHAALDAEVLRPLNLRAGVPLTVWMGQTIEPYHSQVVANATTLTCAAPAG